ncbi:MAG: pyridoxamine 5'-phosphate oxidase family protein [Acidimicrobiales bacterium]
MSTIDVTPHQLTPGLERFEELARLEHHLAVMITRNKDGSPQVSVVNCGIVTDSVSGELRVAMVARRGRKLDNLRQRPIATLVVRAGWEWISVTGAVTIVDPAEEESGSRYRDLARAIFHAAGGVHRDLEVYDAVMIEEGRCPVLLRPERFSTNPPGAEHQDSDGKESEQ